MTLDLKAILERAEKATPGPWRAYDYREGNRSLDTWIGIIRGAFEVVGGCVQVGRIRFSALPHEENVANAEFIAHARVDVPALVREVEGLREKLTIAHGRLWAAGLESHPDEKDEHFLGCPLDALAESIPCRDCRAIYALGSDQKCEAHSAPSRVSPP